MKTLVVGIGNILLSDEGIGIHSLNYLCNYYNHLSDVDYLDGGTLSFTLLPIIEATQNLIVLDAAQLQAQAGTVRCFINAQMDEFLRTTTHRSVHEVNLVDLLGMLHLTESLPIQRALIGVQPQKLDWGECPSPAVAQAIPQVANLVVQLIKTWNS